MYQIFPHMIWYHSVASISDIYLRGLLYLQPVSLCQPKTSQFCKALRNIRRSQRGSTMPQAQINNNNNGKCNSMPFRWVKTIILEIGRFMVQSKHADLLYFLFSENKGEKLASPSVRTKCSDYGKRKCSQCLAVIKPTHNYFSILYSINETTVRHPCWHGEGEL